jgi:hypothetical protein
MTEIICGNSPSIRTLLQQGRIELSDIERQALNDGCSARDALCVIAEFDAFRNDTEFI